MIFGKDAFFAYYVTPVGQTWWFSNFPRAAAPSRREEASTSPADWLAQVADAHARDTPVISKILAASPPPVGAWMHADLTSVPRWHTTRVCLLGDAAYAMSPSAGQGASLAIEDAITLAHHLDRSGMNGRSLAAYETARRDRAEALIKTARRNESNKAVGPIRGLIRDLMLPFFLKMGVKETTMAHGFRTPPLQPATSGP